MKEEKTQGIDTETATKNKLKPTKDRSNTKLLDLKAGYGQHTSPHQNPPSLKGTIPQFIMYCQKQAMAEATIKTKYKILRVMLRKNVNLSNPEEVKLFIE